MLPFRKILCPIDFSAPSYVALDNAIELAHCFGAVFCLLHVIEATPAIPSDTGLGLFDMAETEQAASAKQKMHDLIVQGVPMQVAAFARVRMGHSNTEIVQACRDHGADLIVMATHGETGWRHLVFGSVAEKVVQTAPCAVLTVHRPEHVAADDQLRNSALAHSVAVLDTAAAAPVPKSVALESAV